MSKKFTDILSSIVSYTIVCCVALCLMGLFVAATIKFYMWLF